MTSNAKGPTALGTEKIMPVERSVTIYLNNEEIVTVQSSLEFLEELAVGFLVAEGLLMEPDELDSISVDPKKGMVWISTKGPKEIASKMVGKRFLTSGCGKGFSFSNPGDLRGLAKVESSVTISTGRLNELMKELLIEGRRPGLHCSALANETGLLALRHDIGRHNTVDMLVGHLFLAGRSGDGLVMMTTGRISYEMAVKAAKAKIPIIATRSAATDLAVKVSKNQGIEVAGYVRGRDVTLYTDFGRIVD